jgi:hypothetical protein
MQAIVRGAGDAFLLGCNHPIWPSLGLVHGSRSSNDIKRTWDRVMTTARQNLSRNWQNRRLWWNDPDAVVLSEELTDAECQFHATAIYASGGMVLSGDDLTVIPPARAALLRKLLPPTGVAAEFDDETLRVGRMRLPHARMICLFNWDETPRTLTFRLPDAATITDYWTGERLGRREVRCRSRWRRDRRGCSRPWRDGSITAPPGIQVTATAFAALFSVVGLALYGLPLYYDFMVRELGWSRTMVTSGNAISKLVVGPLFGFAAGWIVDRFGPAAVDDGRHRNGRGGTDWSGGDVARWCLLLLLLFQRARICVRRAAAVPGARLALVRQHAREGDGDRLPRHRRRRRDRAAAVGVADGARRLAPVAAACWAGL